ncbi:MAG: phosphatase PAP2 family protein [Polyangiaceae bacterium]
MHNSVRFFSTVAVVATVATLAPSASAKDPDKVEWSKDWPRMRAAEVADVFALTAGSYAINAYWEPRHTANWSGGILFDGWVRGALKGRTLAAQETAANVSDYLYKFGVLTPYVVDVFFVSLSIHQNADVALEMLLMDMQSLGFAGVLSLSSERLAGRARPYVQECGPDNLVRDAQGNPLLNRCDGVGDFQSFYSGHAAAVTTMAGLTCAHHQHLPLYGGGFADLAPCLLMMGAAGATGVTRIIADRHWATDVMTGWGIGILSGYVLPSVLHYGFSSDHPVGEVRTKNVRMLPSPLIYPGGAGLSMVGLF